MELAAFGDTDLVASDTLFVERLASAFLPTPPFPLPPVSCWLLFRGVSSPAAHHSHRRYPVDHSIRSMHEKPCGPVNGKIPPPQASRPPDSRGGQVNATPVFEDHKMCRRSRIPMSIANVGGHPHPSRRNLKRPDTAFRPFLDVIKL